MISSPDICKTLPSRILAFPLECCHSTGLERVLHCVCTCSPTPKAPGTDLQFPGYQMVRRL